MDFKGRPFGPMPNLMATAEYVTKVHAESAFVQAILANYSHRKIHSDRLVELGEVLTKYEPLSRVAFWEEHNKHKVENL